MDTFGGSNHVLNRNSGSAQKSDEPADAEEVWTLFVHSPSQEAVQVAVLPPRSINELRAALGLESAQQHLFVTDEHGRNHLLERLEQVKHGSTLTITEPRRRIWLSSPPGAPRKAVTWYPGATVEQIEQAIAKAVCLPLGAPLEYKDGDTWIALSEDLPDDLHLDVLQYHGASPMPKARTGRNSPSSEAGSSLISEHSSRGQRRLPSTPGYVGGGVAPGMASGRQPQVRDHELEEIDKACMKELNHLTRQSSDESCARTLSGHSGAVLCLCTVGDVLFSGSQDGTVMIWDLNTLQYIGALAGHEGFVRCLRASLAGKVLCSGSQDAAIRVWSLESFCCVRTLVGHVGDVNALLIVEGKDLLISAGEDRSLRVWDLGVFKVRYVVKQAHTAGINCLEMLVSNHSVQILSGSRDRTIKVWNADAWPRREGRHFQQGHADSVTCLAAAPTRDRLFSGSRDRSIKTWDSETLEPTRHELHVHSDWVQALCLSPSEEFLFSASRDSTVKVWSQDMNCIEVFHGHRGQVNSLASLSMGNRTLLFSGSVDKTVKVWNVDHFA